LRNSVPAFGGPGKFLPMGCGIDLLDLELVGEELSEYGNDTTAAHVIPTSERVSAPFSGTNTAPASTPTSEVEMASSADTTSDTPATADDSDGLGLPIIIGIAAGGVVLIVAVVIIICCCRKRKNCCGGGASADTNEGAGGGGGEKA
jgi:hypothetical protein